VDECEQIDLQQNTRTKLLLHSRAFLGELIFAEAIRTFIFRLWKRKISLQCLKKPTVVSVMSWINTVHTLFRLHPYEYYLLIDNKYTLISTTYNERDLCCLQLYIYNEMNNNTRYNVLKQLVI
jgi:hypothetical protein